MFRELEIYYNSPAHKYINSPQLEEDLMEAAKKMTNKEAIEILKSNKPTSDPRKCGKELCTAVDKAIEALKKQIPKKSVEIITDDNEYPYDRCPSCKRKLYIGQPYCDNCGQAIDWSSKDGR